MACVIFLLIILNVKESLLKNIGNDVTRSLATGNYGGRQTVTLIPGDGVGPELMAGVKKVFNSACMSYL